MTTDVKVTLSRELVEKLVKPWYLIKKRESDVIRAACKEALETKQ
jgi:hypothetical protein